MKKRTLIKGWVVMLLCIFYIVFLDKEVVLKSQSPHTNRYIEIIQYGSGVLDRKTVQVVFLEENKVIAKKPYALLRRVGSFEDGHVSWTEMESSQSERVNIQTVYSTNFFGDLESRQMVFNYASLEAETSVFPYNL
ncbi:hypothetical protein [Domibacillus indicus]|uniref:hypothetical protein n=1 Tax=Domibacillus indicus TaxID=1437523 RepID=UPI000617F1FD|nr:hypothetical protein [Domibacillus indicus]